MLFGGLTLFDIFMHALITADFNVVNKRFIFLFCRRLVVVLPIAQDP